MYHALSDIGSSNLYKISHFYLILVKSGLIDKLLIAVIEMKCPHMLLV